MAARRRRTITGIIAAAGVLARAAAGATIRSDVPESQYQSLGSQSQYAASGYIDALGYDFASGTLVAPDWVLTADHVVTTSAYPPALIPTADVSFGLGASTTPFAAGPDAVSQIVVEPGYDGTINNFSAGDDLALVKLAQPVTSVAPAQLYTSSLPTELGQTATIVGYGLTGTGLTGDTQAEGTRLAIQNSIDAFGGQTTTGGPPSDYTYNFSAYSSNFLLTDFDEPGVPSASVMSGTSPLPLEGASTPGDSGGGLFLTVNGQTYLAGVTDLLFAESTNPLSTNPDGHYGDVNFYLRVSVAQSSNFILSTLQTSSSWSAGGSSDNGGANNGSGSGGGSWASINNWSGQNIPEYQGATASFGPGPGGAITLDGNWTIGTLVFNSANSYTITPGSGGALTFDNGGLSSAAQIAAPAGSHTIAAPLTLNSNVQLSAANSLTISGPIAGAGGITVTAGELELTASNTFSGGTTVDSGASISLSGTDGSITNNGSMTAIATCACGPITGSGSLTIESAATLHLTASGASQQSTLTIDSGATLDLTSNSITIADASDATIYALLASGRNGGAWNGTGITSSTVAAADAAGGVDAPIYAVGYIDLTSGAIEIAPALLGDARLTGSVNFSDFQILADHFGSPGGWGDGNFTYSATIDFGDFQALAANFSAVDSLSAAELASLNQFAGDFGQTLTPNPDGAGFEFASVPEPSPLWLAAAGFALTWRRKRRLQIKTN